MSGLAMRRHSLFKAISARTDSLGARDLSLHSWCGCSAPIVCCHPLPLLISLDSHFPLIPIRSYQNCAFMTDLTPCSLCLLLTTCYSLTKHALIFVRTESANEPWSWYRWSMHLKCLPIMDLDVLLSEHEYSEEKGSSFGLWKRGSRCSRGM